MRIYHLALALLLLFLVPVPGNGGIISSLQRSYCKIRSGRCAVLSCLPKEEQIGTCSLRGRKCCRKKK
ncbi:beta-defensin 103A-like [Pteropus alecto]|uniref:Beta-defensin 103A-like n=1 Tax=Pteropus vampyrus TaxID=132908 RepID=A0A6P3RED5_PTEVA|nr:beta-defensin 103A-like [Pteropus alecto]XP_011375891.1 beta-defensin 103A-like [Pteropus vampyrus]XP_039733292.1 beta-defensin 103A-like [Pteropus giganteus]